MGKLPEVARITEEVKGAPELARSPRSTELQSGGASIGLEHKSSLCSNGEVRGGIQALESDMSPMYL